MSRTPEQIMELYAQRKADSGARLSEMIEVRDVYNGDRQVPLPEMDRDEKVAVANLTKIGTDQIAQRIASTMPALWFPPLRLGIKKSERNADNRRDVTEWWWKQNRQSMLMRKRARVLLAYGMTPIMIRPGLDGHPVWEFRNPLGCYPAEGLDVQDIIPQDVIFAMRRSRSWLEYNYPETMGKLRKAEHSTAFDVVEYVDHDSLTLMVIGDAADSNRILTGAPYKTLTNIPNPVGRCLCVVPRAITLDRSAGQFGSLVGMHQMQSKLMALGVLAAERDVFPETWVVSNAPAGAKIRKYADGLKGVIGVVDGGTVQSVHSTPGQMGAATMDRLEYGMRHTAGVPAELGGQAGTNIRTGKRGDQVLSAVVDFPVQEAQSIFEHSLIEENKIAIALHLHEGKGKTFTVLLNDRKLIYKPEEVFETDEHNVQYAYTGADANGIVIQTGQKIGLETMSRWTAMDHDPMVRDPRAEMDRIQTEKLDAAFMMMLQQQVQQPESPILPGDMARLIDIVKSDKLSLERAYAQVQQEVQARQAAQAQAAQQAAAQQAPPGMPPGSMPSAAGGAPGAPGGGGPPPDPGQMPGLDASAQARQQGEFASIQPPPQSGRNFSDLIAELRRPQAAQPFEQATGPPQGPQ